MDAKLNQSDLTALLAKLCEISVSKADAFTKAFFDVIIEGLESDGIVKINGLGTFKMVDVASRNSVNVNNGEKFEIKGHKKISFLPADSLKEKVNAPFAMFEPVEVDDDYVDDEEMSSEETTDAVEQKNTVDAVAQEVAGNTQSDGPAVETAEQETVAGEQQDSGYSTGSAGEEDVQNAQPAGDAVENVGQQAAVEEGTGTVAVSTEKVSGGNDVPAGNKTKNRGYLYILLSLLIPVVAVIFIWQLYDSNGEIQQPVIKDAIIENVEAIQVDTIAATDSLANDNGTEEEIPAFVLLDEIAQKKLPEITLKDTLLYEAVGNLAVHRVGIDETLVKISFIYYNDKRLWPYIVQYNKLSNFNQLEIGMELEIPRLVKRCQE